MMAMSNKLPEQEPGEIEALLPWHAAGTLNARDAHRVEEALARDPALARQYAVIREEYAETIALNESLGAPSGRAMQTLFSAIDAEPARSASQRKAGLGSRLTAFFGGLSPRTLMAGTAVGALAIMLQAGVIGSIVMQRDGFQPGSLDKQVVGAPPAAPKAPAPSAELAPSAAPLVRSLNAPVARGTGPALLILRFAPTARMSDITALLDAYHGTVVGSDKDGQFRIRFDAGNEAAAGLIRRLENEKAVTMAIPAP